MTTQELKTRIEKAEEKIAKKQNTIAKKTAAIEKKNANAMKLYNVADLAKYDRWTDTEHDEETRYKISWEHHDIVNLNEDIVRLGKEIEATKKTLEKYNAQLAGKEEEDAVYIKEVPEAMKSLQAMLEAEWNEYDKKRRAFLREQYRNMSYGAFIKKYMYAGYDFMHKSDEDIEKENARDAKMFVLNLYYRVKDITGTVTDWRGVQLEQGNIFPVLTGVVIGEQGRARVETILAGGYNIQRLHIRTLVYEF